MRKLILSMQVSLDGYIESSTGDMDWMDINSNDGWDVVFDMMKNIDLLLLGRKMYNGYRDFWKNALVDPDAAENDRRYAVIADSLPHIVFSKTLKEAGWSNTIIHSGDVVEEIIRLKNQDGKDIYLVGGAKLASTALDAQLVDELILKVAPVLLGGGKSLFLDVYNRQELKLTDVRSFSNGMVDLTYHRKQ
jgi:dihydrofolate reductase